MTSFFDKNVLIKWLVLLGDVLAYAVLVKLMTLFLGEYTPPSVMFHSDVAAVMGILFLLVFSLIFPTVIHRRRIDFREVVIRNVIVTFLTQLCFANLWHVITHNSSNEINYNSILAVALFLTLVFLRILEKWVLGFVRSKGRNSRMVLFVGSDPANLNIYREIMSDPTTGYNVLGYYSNDVIQDAPQSLKKLGSRDELIDIVTNRPEDLGGVDELFCSLSHVNQDQIMSIMRYCERAVIHFYYVPRISHNLQMALKPELLGNSVVFTNHYEPLSIWGNKLIKRTFDIVFSSLVLLLMLPFLPVIYCIIKLQSPGPMLFRQERTGMSGHNFICYKFRSMHVNSQADTLQATKHDPRKFPFGDFMRRTNIDELPQFFNVLKGDMSVVGPRPHMTLHTEQYSALIEKYMMRHFAKPGITGWAQVTGYRGETEELWQMEGRVQKDIWYIEHWSLWLDIQICFKTALSMIIPDKNAY